MNRYCYKIIISLIFNISFYSTLKIVKILKKSSLEDIRAYHLDCGRKYFSINEIKDIIDLLSKNNYNYFELAIGNGGMRFLLDSMEINSLGKTYKSHLVKNAIKYGNILFYDCGQKNELTQNEMDEIIDYARIKHIEIIPLLNSPGHMEALLKAMNLLTGKNCAFRTSERTIDIMNEIAIDFTKKILQLYINYFHSKNIKYFNIGCDEYANDLKNKGFKFLIESGQYGFLINYINEIAEMVESKNMNVIAFNDPFYYDNIRNFEMNNKMVEFKKSIIISYWFSGHGRLHHANAKILSKAGFKILNTNIRWYYVLGRKFDEYSLKNKKYYIVHGAGIIPIIGTMVCAWCDFPWVKYEGKKIENIRKQIEYFAEANSYDKINSNN